MNKLLDVKNVSISFLQYTKGLNQRDLKIITDLTLDISEGEILVVLGSSGSGKSLLAHAIFGILPENAILKGSIEYNGKILFQKDKEKIRGKQISLIPQSINFLDPLMKISDQVIGHSESDEEKNTKKKWNKEKYLNDIILVLKWMICIHSNYLEVWQGGYLYLLRYFQIQNW